MSRLAVALAAGILMLASASTNRSLAQSSDDWPYYGHDAGGMRYSPLAQISRQNVANLKVAWTFHVGDISEGGGGKKRTGLETTPILVDGTLYLTTGLNRVFALDPETGRQRWVYDPMVDTAMRLRRRAYQSRRRSLGGCHAGERQNRAGCEFSRPPWTLASSRSTARPASPASTSVTADKSVCAMSHGIFRRSIT